MPVSTIPAPQPEKQSPKFIFLEKSSTIDSYESFAKEGFADLITNQVEFPYNQEKDFLNRVDLSKGPIMVSVQSIIRTMAVDWDSPKRERKEYLYYTTEWEAKDWLGNVIRCPHENEGRYTRQTKEIKIKLNQQTGEQIHEYQRGQTRDTYTIPWDKKTADLILTGEKYFGKDSINITNLAEVQYVVKFPYGNPGRTGFGMSDFLDLKYEKLQELSKSVKSPYLADLERRVNPYK